MKNDSYEKLADKIEKLNFHAYRERIEIQKNLTSIAAVSKDHLAKNGNLLKVIITLQILNLCKEFPAVAELLKLISL